MDNHNNIHETFRWMSDHSTSILSFCNDKEILTSRTSVGYSSLVGKEEAWRLYRLPPPAVLGSIYSFALLPVVSADCCLRLEGGEEEDSRFQSWDRRSRAPSSNSQICLWSSISISLYVIRYDWLYWWTIWPISFGLLVRLLAASSLHLPAPL